MNKKIISAFLACSLPLTACNSQFSSAWDNGYQYFERGSFSYAQKRDLEAEIERLQNELKQKENEEKVKQLEKEIQKLSANNKKQNESSLWSSIKRKFKSFFSTNMGVISSVGATLATVAAAAALYTTGVAAYDCANDDTCSFKSKSFLKKFNKETFKNSFSTLTTFVLECLKHVHVMVVESDKYND